MNGAVRRARRAMIRRLGSFAAVAGVCALLVFTGFEVRSSLWAFVPQGADQDAWALSQALSGSAGSRALVFRVTAIAEAARDAMVPAPGTTHFDAAELFARALSESNAFSSVRLGLGPKDADAFESLYFPARFGFLPQDAGAPVTDAWLQARIDALYARLAGAELLSDPVREAADPLGLYGGALSRAQAFGPTLQMEGGRFASADGASAMVFATTRADAFSGADQAVVEAVVRRATAAVERAFAGAKVAYAGVPRRAHAEEMAVRRDLSRISTLSLLGIALLYLCVFRSLREAVLVMVPLAFGTLCALAVCRLAFGAVHGLALAFGASILGVAEDYSTHYLFHVRHGTSDADPETLAAHLWPGMALGCATTLVGVLGLFVSGFPGLVQMATFACVGVLGALLCTRYVLPYAVSARHSAPAGVGRPLHRRARTLPWARRLALAAVLPFALLAAFGCVRITPADGAAALSTRLPALDADDAAVRAALGRNHTRSVLVVARGVDDEAALVGAERVAERLAQRVRGGASLSVRSPTTLLPSRAAQQRSYAVLHDDPTLSARLGQALDARGFVVEAFAPFFSALRAPLLPVVPEQVLRSSLGDLLLPARTARAHDVLYTTVVDLPPAASLVGVFDGEPDISVVDQPHLLQTAHGALRKRIGYVSAVGIGLVSLLLWLRYRRLRTVVAGLIPAVLGGLAALGMCGWLGISVSFMHVVALLLVVSMGVDYGIYFLESRTDPLEAETTVGSVLLSAATTLLSFGLLALSANAALSAIGLTVALGLGFTVLLSPLAWVVAGPALSP